MFKASDMFVFAFNIIDTRFHWWSEGEHSSYCVSLSPLEPRKESKLPGTSLGGRRPHTKSYLVYMALGPLCSACYLVSVFKLDPKRAEMNFWESVRQYNICCFMATHMRIFLQSQVTDRVLGYVYKFVNGDASQCD